MLQAIFDVLNHSHHGPCHHHGSPTSAFSKVNRRCSVGAVYDIHLCHIDAVPSIGAFPFTSGVLLSTAPPLICCIHQGQLIAILLPDGTMQTLKSKVMASWLFSANTSERYAKMAASFKVSMMIYNALQLHRVAEDVEIVDISKEIPILRTSAAVALGRYTNLSRQKVVFGGFAWVMRQYWTSALASKEGIVFGARLIEKEFGSRAGGC